MRKKPKQYRISYRTKFAFTPTWDESGSMLWLEKYLIRQVDLFPFGVPCQVWNKDSLEYKSFISGIKPTSDRLRIPWHQVSASELCQAIFVLMFAFLGVMFIGALITKMIYG